MSEGSNFLIHGGGLVCAQTGCDDSPEDPTLVLALVGGAGALAARLWKSRAGNL